MAFMLLAIVVVTAAVAIGVALGGGGMAVAKKQANAPATSDATIVATPFQVGGDQTKEAYAKCPSNKRALGGGVVQSGQAPPAFWCERAARWTRQMTPPRPSAATSPSSGMPLNITGDHNQRTSR